MANNCWYTMRAVSKSREALNRLVAIMNYEDPEYFMYRVFSAEPDEIKSSGDLFYVDIAGDDAWSCDKWFHGEEDNDCKLDLGKNRDAHYVPLTVVCERLGIAVEVWSMEIGDGFQEHYVLNSKGELVIDDYTDIGDGRPDSAFCAVGGFKDYGKFAEPWEIYN